MKKSKNIITVLNNLPEAKPSPLFKVRLYFKLLRTINSQHVSFFLASRILFPAKALGAFFLIMLVTMSSATTLYAYYNPNITSESPLYVVKTSIENIQKVAAFTPEQKVSVFSNLAQRRAKEAEIFAEKNGTVDTKLIEEIKLNNTEAFKHVKSIPDKNEQKKSKEIITSSSTKQTESLKKVKEISISKATEESKDVVIELEDKNAIFLSAPTEMDHISVRDEMLLEKNAEGYGLVESNDGIVVSGFLPDDEDITTEDEIITESPDLKLLNDVLVETESLSDEKNVDQLLEEEAIIIN